MWPSNDVSVSGVAITDAAGAYSLTVPVMRTVEGAVSSEQEKYTLRADAAGYVTFPKAPRSPLPVDVTQPDGNGIVKNTATDIGLIPLPSSAGLGSVSGKVLSEKPVGTL